VFFFLHVGLFVQLCIFICTYLWSECIYVYFMTHECECYACWFVRSAVHIYAISISMYRKYAPDIFVE